ncbi:hypothetical protein HJFPF1_13240 [Paramyrothecium foliicola]|nr:hypothetical protein HJFPF1_13240 [Paramyrothecium foliicola]
MALSTPRNDRAIDSRYSIISTPVAEFHNTMKLSLLLKDNMPDFLATAPLAVSLLGHLRLFAWSTAANVEIETKEGSFFKLVA